MEIVSLVIEHPSVSPDPVVEYRFPFIPQNVVHVADEIKETR
jgi:hypothetical protein